MESNEVISLIAMETAEPKRKLNRSAGSVYVLLIAVVIGTISLANLLYARWQIPRYIVQPAIYTLTAAIGLYLYLRHTISYRYTLTDSMFAIERIAFNGERTIVAAPLNDILEIERPVGAQRDRTRARSATVFSRRNSMIIRIRENGAVQAYRISPSDEFVSKLFAQRQAVQKEKES